MSLFDDLSRGMEKSLIKALDETHKQILQKYQAQIDRERLKQEIIAELKPYIDQMASNSITIQVKENAIPALKELDETIKNLGHL